MYEPKIAICITTYNRATRLENCLNSIAIASKQYDGRFEVCISDNGSTDETDAVVKKANHACIDDLFMIFTPNVKSIIDTIDIYDAIDLRFLDTGNENLEYNKALYHDLWTWTLTELIGVEGVCNLPPCINPSFREDRFN